ncbi:CsgG/HfaB family protein [Swingsia samuiensis]|uniref:Curli production assembly protein CsgG n=1 Tax=Swingsia samuiensis TaxID=1293412 RepID=A0A4Y6ULZ8_9PROT|nr:CsgG/HfaB family protein [Swingsia samuiensis]QDH17698.1 hypothetical protein E3D00_09065 [Swingsia samuiensis]
MKKNISSGLVAGAFFFLAGCATESSRSVEVPQVASVNSVYTGVRQPVSIGQFDNRSTYMRGIFSGGTDTLGSQAKTLLETDLQQTNHFDVLDRDNLAQLTQENGFSHTKAQIHGARYVITGDVTEFGRKEVGDQELFGLLGRGKAQVAYAKVNLNIVDTATSSVVYSTQGAGEYQLSNREVVGFGGFSTYDSTLNGKVLDLAIREAVNHLVKAIDGGAWTPSR